MNPIEGALPEGAMCALLVRTDGQEVVLRLADPASRATADIHLQPGAAQQLLDDLADAIAQIAPPRQVQ